MSYAWVIQSRKVAANALELTRLLLECLDTQRSVLEEGAVPGSRSSHKLVSH